MVHSFYWIHFLLRIATDGVDDDDDGYSIDDDAFFLWFWDYVMWWDDGDDYNEYRLQLFWWLQRLSLDPTWQASNDDDDDDDDVDGDYNEYRLQLFWPQFCVLASLASGRGEPHWQWCKLWIMRMNKDELWWIDIISQKIGNNHLNHECEKSLDRFDKGNGKT